MTDAQESMVKAKLAEIADAIPAFRGAIVAISTGNDGEEGDVTVFKSGGDHAAKGSRTLPALWGCRPTRTHIRIPDYRPGWLVESP